MDIKKPYPFQLEDAQKMLSVGNCVCGHEPGVGKTAIGIQLITPRTLVVVPKSVLYQYVDEIKAFKPEIKAFVVSGSPEYRKRQYSLVLDVPEATLLLTYETFRSDYLTLVKINPKFRTMIFDEVHRLASITTKTHKAIRAFLAYYKNTGIAFPSIYGFTASLIMNSPMDIYGVFNILRPGLFPNFMAFTQKYMHRHPTFGYVLGARKATLPELGRIISPFYIRRTLSDVAPELPPHIDEIVKFDLSPKETKLYNDIRAELLLEIDPKHIDLVKNPLSLQTALTKMQKLSELTDSPDLIGHSGIKSTKIEILEDKLAELLTDNDRKCVVFSRFARMINILAPLLAKYNPVVIQGSVGGEDRQTNITKFKTDPTCRLMLITTAGSEGISLEEASFLIRLDTPFSIGRDIQLTGRIRRITTLEPTFSFTLVAKNTVDEKMLKILERKKIINSAVFTIADVKELLE